MGIGVPKSKLISWKALLGIRHVSDSSYGYMHTLPFSS